MNPPDTARHATRRRVRRFIAAGVLAVLAVGFWPVTGFSIRNRDDFVGSLDQPSFCNYSPPLQTIPSHRKNIYTFETEGERFRTTPERPNTVYLSACRTFRCAGAWFEVFSDNYGPAAGAKALDRSGAAVKIGINSTGYVMLVFKYRNVYGEIWVVSESEAEAPGRPEGKTGEQIALECLDAIIAGLEGGAPGVRVEYMPPAVMLWRDRVSPFLRKRWP